MTPPDINGRKTPPQPSLRPTSVASLCVAALATAALAWLAISRFYGDFHATMPWLPPLTFLGLALVEAVAASSTKARIDRKEGTIPVNPLVVARYVVLAKASALAGALFFGMYAGILLWLLSEGRRLTHAASDLPQTAIGVVGAFALVAAALWLERSCRVPPVPPEQGAPTDDDRSDLPEEGRTTGERSTGGRSGGGWTPPVNDNGAGGDG
jgi:hypothetical protein